MRRHLLHIFVASLAFSAGFLTADGAEGFAYALPLAIAAFVLTKAIRCFAVDFHFLMIAVCSCFLWAAGAYALQAMLSFGDCVIDFSEPETSLSSSDVPADTVITMERTRCFGNCPAYTISIFADGTVIFYGRPKNGFTKVTGAMRTWITKEQLRELVWEFETNRFFKFENRYEAVNYGCSIAAIQRPVVITTFQSNGRKKTIEHVHGCVTKERHWTMPPKELTFLENKIDYVTRSDQWLKSRNTPE